MPELQLAPLKGDLSRAHELLEKPRAPKMQIEPYAFTGRTLREGDGEQQKAVAVPAAEGEIPEAVLYLTPLRRVAEIAPRKGRNSTF